MTKEEVKALIKAKIEGQGTNVDAGSVLPLILNGIIDLIDEGGGGTSDAVQYVPQELTAEQQAQARTNIGAGTSNFNGNPVLVTEQELTESQQMQARKNQDLYYEEEGMADKTITFEEGVPPASDWKDTAFGIVDMSLLTSDLYIKVSDDVPSINDWGEILDLNGQPKTEEFIEGNNYYLIARNADYADYPDIIVIENDNTTVTHIGEAPKRGIYVGYIVQTNRSMDRTNWEIVGPYVTSITYEGTITTVHQIPAKYIPSTGLDVFEVEFSSMNPQQLNEVDLPNYTYEQIESAVASGKLLVLTLKNNANAVWGRYIGGQLSRMSDIEGGDYGMPCIRIPAAYSYLEQTIQGRFVGTKVMDIVIYEDWSQGEDEPTLMLKVEDSFNV